MVLFLQVSYVSTPISQYKNYFEKVLCRNSLAVPTALACEKFLLDDTGKFGDDGGSPGTNQSKRAEWFKGGNKVDFKIPLSSDV